jgi:hypothetical protein
MIGACLERPYELYNERADQDRIELRWCDDWIAGIIERLGVKRPPKTEKKEPFEKVFKPVFPAGAIESGAIDAMYGGRDKPVQGRGSGNTYIFKVSLNKCTWRRIKISASHTLHHLHEAIQDAFKFYDDHLYAFFMDGQPWSRKAYWCREDNQQPYADKAIIGRLDLTPGQRFLYLFDFGDEWMFDVQVEEILLSDVPPARPVVLESKGAVPEQDPDYF